MRDPGNRVRNRGIWPGVFIVCIGIWILASRALAHYGYPYPDWVFTWPMILIGVGFFVGLSNGFRGNSWAVLVLIGGVFLLDRTGFLPWDFRRYIWPLGIIVFGLFLVSGANRSRHRWHHWGSQFDLWGRVPPPGTPPPVNPAIPPTNSPGDPPANPASNPSFSSPYYASGSLFGGDDEFIDVTAFMGTVRRNSTAKHLRGGDITSVLGDAVIDLGLADFQGQIRLDLTAVLGGIKIIVPRNWMVKSQVVAVLGNVEDKRADLGIPDPAKTIILDGTTFMGNIVLLCQPGNRTP
ncbi:MAG TPA: DUF5668 domain-containing protein [Chitinophagaceae bacterium]|nr:DUF5668 domain-containing protein [Chitinophagaceae bacterium]